jgi:LPS-assembly lipoprotein
MLRHVEVAPIPGRGGWMVYNKLKEQLAESGAGGVPSYRLQVELDDEIVGLAIRGDRAATRERRILRARYQLVEIATGQVLLDATAGSDAGIDVVSSEYATVAAEQTAEERLAEIVAGDIVDRLGLYANRTGARP